MPTEVKLNDNFSYFHKYRIDGDNLMDDYNNTIAGQKKNGVWEVVTDPTIKYGALADSLGMGVLVGLNRGGGDMAHPGDNRYIRMGMNAVFTGEWNVVDWVYPKTGQTIKDYRASVVYKDGDGTVKKLWVSVFSPDTSGEFAFRWREGDSNLKDTIPGLELLARYLPGQLWYLLFVHDGPDLELVNDKCYPNGFCGEELNRLMYLRYEQKEKTRSFVESWKDGDTNSSEVPEGWVMSKDLIEVLNYKK